MTTLLFDAPAWLLVLLAIVGLAVTFTGLRRGQINMRNTGLAMLAAAALLFVLRATVQTDEKQVEKQARGLVEAVSRKDWATAAKYLRHARMYEWDGDELVRRATELSAHYGLTGVVVNSVDVQRDPNVITATLSVTSSHQGTYVDSVPSTWKFEYQKRAEGWVLTKLFATRVGTFEMGQAEEIIRMK